MVFYESFSCSKRKKEEQRRLNQQTGMKAFDSVARLHENIELEGK